MSQSGEAIAAAARGERLSSASARGQNLWPLIVCAVLQVALGLLVARSYLTLHNTLQNNGRWQATKTTLERGVLGAFAFTTQRQALAHGRLDLAAWHGHQEVFYREPLDPERLEFQFRLPSRSSLSVLFNRVEDQGFAGLRLSNMTRFPSMFFVADDEGRFLSRRTLPGAEAANVWHWAAIELGDEAVSLRLDGQPLGEFPVERRSPQQIGFRGSARGGLIDDVVVRQRDGTTVRESFGAPRGAAAIMAGVPALLVAGNLLLFLLLVGRSPAQGRTLGLYLAMASVSFVLMAALLCAFIVWRADRYPLMSDALLEEETYRRAGEARRVIWEIRQGHPPARQPGIYRIVFVGSSQTWGAGAQRKDQTFSARLESQLNERGGGAPRYECIAGGISGTRAAFLRAVLEREWLRLQPELVVINLSSNDESVKRFVGPLEGMAQAALATGARVVFVKEANSPEADTRSLLRRHEAMDGIAARYGIPVIDMHGYLRSVADTGFLWWDDVHLTSFGQRLMAEKLYAELLPVIRGETRQDGSSP